MIQKFLFFLTIIALTKQELKIELNPGSIGISNSIEVSLIKYFEDIDKVQEQRLNCSFERNRFCAPGTDAHIFEINIKNLDVVNPLKQDNQTYAIITVVCKGVLDVKYEASDAEMHLEFKNPFSIVRFFNHEKIYGCDILDMNYIEDENVAKTNNSLKFHQMIFDINPSQNFEEHKHDHEIDQELDRAIQSNTGILMNMIYMFVVFAMLNQLQIFI